MKLMQEAAMAIAKQLSFSDPRTLVEQCADFLMELDAKVREETQREIGGLRLVVESCRMGEETSAKRIAELEAEVRRTHVAWGTATTEIDHLRKAVLNQCGDNLCWVVTPETAKALPEAEFMESCRRYRQQIADERGEFTGGMTIAQLEAQLSEQAERVKTLEVALWALAGRPHRRACNVLTGGECDCGKAQGEAALAGAEERFDPLLRDYPNAPTMLRREEVVVRVPMPDSQSNAAAPLEQRQVTRTVEGDHHE